jgi:hypothetical protein
MAASRQGSDSASSSSLARGHNNRGAAAGSLLAHSSISRLLQGGELDAEGEQQLCLAYQVCTSLTSCVCAVLRVCCAVFTNRLYLRSYMRCSLHGSRPWAVYKVCLTELLLACIRLCLVEVCAAAADHGRPPPGTAGVAGGCTGTPTAAWRKRSRPGLAGHCGPADAAARSWQHTARRLDGAGGKHSSCLSLSCDLADGTCC